MATRSRSKVSARADRFWKRLAGWYGARLAEQYGEDPPQDWCAVVDDASNETIQRALAEIKIRHTVYPPTFPEFDAIVAKLSRAAAVEPSTAERLHDYIVNNRTLTPAQLRARWEYHGLDGTCVAVDVPPDGDVPGFRVRVDDLLQWQPDTRTGL